MPADTPTLGGPGSNGALGFVSLAFEWNDGPSMLQPRAHPAVVALEDGRIAAIGGLTTNGPTSSTEILDPTLGAWKPGPTMASKRIGHTATLLPDGAVCVVGGDTGEGATASAELLNFSGGFSTPLPSMFFARTGHSSVLLGNAKLLVAGGTDWRTEVWRAAELFDPNTRTWSPAGNMDRARLFACAERLPDGSALMIGGDTGGTSEVFDPGQGFWGSLAAMSSKRSRAASATLSDGSVVVAGGLAGESLLRSSEVYDPLTRTWTPSGEMAEMRASFGLVRLLSGDLLASGSYSSKGPSATCEIFSPSDSTWHLAEAMRVPRGAHGCGVDSAGSVYVFGGWSGAALTPTTERFSRTPPVKPDYCQPIDLLPLVRAAEELPGQSHLGLEAKLWAAQARYEAGDYETCVNIMNAFYHQVAAFAGNGHMTSERAADIYDAYASVVTCIGGDPLPSFPGK